MKEAVVWLAVFGGGGGSGCGPCSMTTAGAGGAGGIWIPELLAVGFS